MGAVIVVNIVFVAANKREEDTHAHTLSLYYIHMDILKIVAATTTKKMKSARKAPSSSSSPQLDPLLLL